MFCICGVRLPSFHVLFRISKAYNFTFPLHTFFVKFNQFASNFLLRNFCSSGLWEPLTSTFYPKPSASALVAYTLTHFVNWTGIRPNYQSHVEVSTFSLNLLDPPGSKEFSIFFPLWDPLRWKKHLVRINSLWLTPSQSRYALATKTSSRGHIWSRALVFC